MNPYYLINDEKTFAFSAENPTGTRAGGSRGGDCTKLRPFATIQPGETLTLVDTDGPGKIQSSPCGLPAMWDTALFCGFTGMDRDILP